jgi:hypothetical protein
MYTRLKCAIGCSNGVISILDVKSNERMHVKLKENKKQRKMSGLTPTVHAYARIWE